MYYIRPIEDCPLHCEELFFFVKGLSFWACEFPERPTVYGETCYDWRCRPCWLHGKTWLSVQGDHGVTDDRQLIVPLAEAVAAADEYHRSLV